MSDNCDNLKPLAAASINAFATPTPGIEFKNNVGFSTATRSGPGAYDLELKHEHDSNKLVVQVTQNNAAVGSISASLPSKGHVQVNSLDTAGDPADSAFWITVYLVED